MDNDFSEETIKRGLLIQPWVFSVEEATYTSIPMPDGAKYVPSKFTDFDVMKARRDLAVLYRRLRQDGHSAAARRLSAIFRAAAKETINALLS